MKRATWIGIALAAAALAVFWLYSLMQQRALEQRVDALVTAASVRLAEALQPPPPGAAPDVWRLVAADAEDAGRIVTALQSLRTGPDRTLAEAAAAYLALVREVNRHYASLPRLRAEIDESRRALEARRSAPAAEKLPIFKRYEAANVDLRKTAASLAGLLDSLPAAAGRLTARRGSAPPLDEAPRQKALERAVAEARAAEAEMEQVKQNLGPR